jgi:hypothetical protein
MKMEDVATIINDSCPESNSRSIYIPSDRQKIKIEDNG